MSARHNAWSTVLFPVAFSPSSIAHGESKLEPLEGITFNVRSAMPLKLRIERLLTRAEPARRSSVESGPSSTTPEYSFQVPIAEDCRYEASASIHASSGADPNNLVTT